MMHLLGSDTETSALNVDQINNDFLNRLNANTDDEDDEKFNYSMSKDPNMSNLIFIHKTIVYHSKLIFLRRGFK